MFVHSFCGTRKPGSSANLLADPIKPAEVTYTTSVSEFPVMVVALSLWLCDAQARFPVVIGEFCVTSALPYHSHAPSWLHLKVVLATFPAPLACRRG